MKIEATKGKLTTTINHNSHKFWLIGLNNKTWLKNAKIFEIILYQMLIAYRKMQNIKKCDKNIPLNLN